MQILFSVIEEDKPNHQWRSFTYDLTTIPRVGETVVRHVEGESSLANRFVVHEVIHVLETREWYLERKMFNPVVVLLKLQTI